MDICTSKRVTYAVYLQQEMTMVIKIEALQVCRLNAHAGRWSVQGLAPRWSVQGPLIPKNHITITLLKNVFLLGSQKNL